MKKFGLLNFLDHKILITKLTGTLIDITVVFYFVLTFSRYRDLQKYPNLRQFGPCIKQLLSKHNHTHSGRGTHLSRAAKTGTLRFSPLTMRLCRSSKPPFSPNRFMRSTRRPYKASRPPSPAAILLRGFSRYHTSAVRPPGVYYLQRCLLEPGIY